MEIRAFSMGISRDLIMVVVMTAMAMGQISGSTERISSLKNENKVYIFKKLIGMDG